MLPTSPSAKASSSTVRIGTYNILNPFHAVKWRTSEGLDDQGQDNWQQGRSASIIRNLTHAPIDICALQEISTLTYPALARAQLNQKSCLLSNLYTHFTQDSLGAHGVTVLYCSERFERVNDVCVQTLSSEYRCTTSVDLKDRNTGKVYRIASVHLKGYNPYEENISEKRNAQKRGDLELQRYVNELLQDTEGLQGIFILGDFNEDAEEMKARGHESRQGVLMQQHFSWSNTFESTEVRTGRQIDWIFYRDFDAQPHTLKHLSLKQDLSASDHMLTAAELSFD